MIRSVAAERLLGFFRDWQMPTVGGAPVTLAAHSVCIHGDSADAVAMARHIRGAFTARGLGIAPFIARG